MYPDIVFGAGAFNTQYNYDKLDDISEVLKCAIESGIVAIDTAAFYGPSEILVGEALAKLPFKREEYMLCSKCCRWETNEFEFSRDAVRRSVNRSLERLKSPYLDVLYIHDVEFGDPDQVIKAIEAAFELKRENIVRNVGISGYPLDILLKCVKLVNEKLDDKLDCVLSYCNLTLQNNLLLEYEPKFRDLGVKYVLNASPLSMTLLRNDKTHDFHPAQPDLRARADKIGEELQAEGLSYATVALEYAFHAWKGKPTVLGLRTIEETKQALKDYKQGIKESNPVWDRVIAEFGEFHNVTWEEELPKKVRHLWDALQI